MSRRIPITAEKLEQERTILAPVTIGFELLTEEVIITDADSNILYANKAAQDKTGFTIEEMLGNNPGDLWGGHMQNEHYVEMYHTLRDLKQYWQGPVKNRYRDGTKYWQWLIVIPILDDKNECKYFLSVEPDVDPSKFETPEKFSQTFVGIIALKNLMNRQNIKIADLTKIAEELKNELNSMDSRNV